MAARNFFDVFTELKKEGQYAPGLSDAQITKIGTSRDHRLVRIYLESRILIPKRRIWRLERSIREKYFADGKTQVHIIEHFTLPPVYTPERLYETYQDSILEEISKNLKEVQEDPVLIEENVLISAQTEVVLREVIKALNQDSDLHSQEEEKAFKI